MAYYIDAEKLENTFFEVVEKIDSDSIHIDSIVDIIQNMPEADVPWKAYSHYDHDVCARCGNIRPMRDADDEPIQEEKIGYCWFCGADMRGCFNGR